MLRDRIAPWLEDRGFRRRDATFRREQAGAWQIVNLQRRRASTASTVRLTVNLGVALPTLEEGEPAWAGRGWPLEHECHFRERLAFLVRGEDHWWRVRALVPARRTAADILGGLEKHGLPWLELYADPPRLLRDATADPGLVKGLNLTSLARLAHAAGSPEQVAFAERELARWRAGS